MPVKVTVQGIQRNSSNRDYAEQDFSIEIDEDLTEQEIFNLVMKEAGDGGLYRKRGVLDDRIQIEYIGVQRDEPMIRLQPREKGQFRGYDKLGRDLWAIEGKANTQPRDPVTQRWISYEQYARNRGVSFATGEVSARIKTTGADLVKRVIKEFDSADWKSPQKSTYWRKQSVQRVKSPYKQLSFEED